MLGGRGAETQMLAATRWIIYPRRSFREPSDRIFLPLASLLASSGALWTLSPTFPFPRRFRFPVGRLLGDSGSVDYLGLGFLQLLIVFCGFGWVAVIVKRERKQRKEVERMSFVKRC